MYIFLYYLVIEFETDDQTFKFGIYKHNIFLFYFLIKMNLTNFWKLLHNYIKKL